MFVRKLLKFHLTKPVVNLFLSRFAFSQVPKMNPNKDYYRILDVPRDINTDQIQFAFSKLAHIYDPAINPANKQKYDQIVEAKNILGNQRLRKQYDKQRFFVKFTDQMKTRFQRQHQEPYQTKQKDKYSFDLTPQENEVYQKTRRFIKRVLIVGIGLALFLPFVIGVGGSQPSVNEAEYNIRPSSIHRAEIARRKQEYQQAKQAYQQQYPNSTPPQNYALGYQNPNIIVTGEIVTD